MNLKDRARAYFEDARRLEHITGEMGGLSGPQWAIVYRAVAAELRSCADCVCPPDGVTIACPTHQGESVPPVSEDMKVSYVTLSGSTSVAYTSGIFAGGCGCYRAHDKHTDEPVYLAWVGQKWREVSAHGEVWEQ